MKIPTVGTIGSIALLGGLGYVAYKFIKGEWKLPTLPELPTLPTPDPETYEESGTPGQWGDIIYQSTMPPDLRPRVTQRKTRLDYAGVPGDTYAKAVAETVSEDIIEGGLIGPVIGFPGSEIFGIPSPATTIGAGLGAISQHEKWKATLTPDEKALADYEEAFRRHEFKQTEQGLIGVALSMINPITGAITLGSTVADMITVSKGKPVSRKIERVRPTEPLPTVREFIMQPLPERMQTAKEILTRF